MFEQTEDVQKKEASTEQGFLQSQENTSTSSSTPEQDQSVVTPEQVSQEISEFLRNCERDTKGKIQFPKNMNPVYCAAIVSEDRRRNTQAHITKVQQENKQLKTTKKVLTEELGKRVVPALSSADKERLEELKHQDPDAWRNEMNAIENKQFSSTQEDVQKRIAEEQASEDARILAEQQQEYRRILVEWKAQHPELAKYTDQDILDRIPPYLNTKVYNGEMGFHEALQELAVYLQTPKQTATQPQTTGHPDLSKFSGYTDTIHTKNTSLQQDTYTY